MPCLNEASYIEPLLEAVRQQDWPVSEVVIADCGSTDGTLERIAAFQRRVAEFPLRVISCLTASTPMALNAAIDSATSEIAIRLDGHSRPDPGYVRRSVESLMNAGASVVGGTWHVEPGAATPMGRAIAQAVSHPFGAGDARYRIGVHDGRARSVDTVPFGSFRKELWTRLGGFDERLLANQDYEFNYRVRRAGLQVVLDPSIQSAYTARPTLRALASQYFRYGWWKAEMLKRHPRSLRWRQAIPAVFVAGLVGLSLAAIWSPIASRGLGLLVAVYGAAVLAATVHCAWLRRDWRVASLLPSIFAVIHLVWGVGLLVNLLTAGHLPLGMRFGQLPPRSADKHLRDSRI